MFYTFNTATFHKELVAFTIADEQNRIIDIGISTLATLTTMNETKLPPDAKVTVLVVDRDEDIARLANRFSEWLHKHGLESQVITLRNLVMKRQAGNRGKGKGVVCLDTGETWPTITAAAHAAGVAYTQMHNHLKERVGFKTVKGRRYGFNA